jgi:hypothetical protein
MTQWASGLLCYSMNAVNQMWIIKNYKDLLEYILLLPGVVQNQ